MSIKGTNLPFNPNEKPEGMSEKEWSVIDQLLSLDLKVTAIKAFLTRREREAAAPKKPAEPPAKAKAPKIGYIAQELVALNLPHKKPSGEVWVRKNGNLALIVQGGHYIDQKTGEVVKTAIPYGSTARLILFYIMSAAALSDTPKIYLGNSFDAFLKAIGATPESRGLKTGARAVLSQIYNIIYASFSIQKMSSSDEFDIERGHPNRRLVEEYEIWFSKKNTGKAQQGLWGSYIELSKELFQSLKKNPIPIDWEVVLKLRKNSTALDFYALLTYESAKAQAAGKGRFIPWASLQEQMGSETSRLKDFSAKARAAILLIQKHYKGLKVSFPNGGLKIEAASLPSVPPKELTPPQR